MSIERDWITEAGLRAVCYLIPDSHRCGYVMVPPGHPLHGVGYHQECDALREWPAVTAAAGKRSLTTLITAGVGATTDDGIRRSPDVAFDVHGSLTYSDGDPKYPAPSDNGWWFGFDCAHSSDGSLDPRRQEYSSGPVRSQEYVEAECESLARQIVDLVPQGGLLQEN